MENIKLRWQKLPTALRKMLVAIIGILTIIVGIILLVLPGPGWLVIFSGLAILATEFAFADRLRIKIERRFKSALIAIRRKH